jgi:hypothetical protein
VPLISQRNVPIEIFPIVFCHFLSICLCSTLVFRDCLNWRQDVCHTYTVYKGRIANLLSICTVQCPQRKYKYCKNLCWSALCYIWLPRLSIGRVGAPTDCQHVPLHVLGTWTGTCWQSVGTANMHCQHVPPPCTANRLPTCPPPCPRSENTHGHVCVQ